MREQILKIDIYQHDSLRERIGLVRQNHRKPAPKAQKDLNKREPQGKCNRFLLYQHCQRDLFPLNLPNFPHRHIFKIP